MSKHKYSKWQYTEWYDYKFNKENSSKYIRKNTNKKFKNVKSCVSPLLYEYIEKALISNSTNN